MNNRNGQPLFVPGGGNVPIVGGPEAPVMLQTATLITPQLRKKLEEWTGRCGIIPGDLGLMMMRIGLVGLSQIIESDPSQWITGEGVKEFLPDQVPGHEKED